jgi:CHASE2 domain-containing sensor protein
LIKTIVFFAASGLSALVAHGLEGENGLRGAGLGILIAAVLCGVSLALNLWARRAKGNALLAAMYGSMLASFGLLIAAMILLRKWVPDLLTPAILTALAIYMAFRFTDAFRVAKAPGRTANGGSWS